MPKSLELWGLPKLRLLILKLHYDSLHLPWLAHVLPQCLHLEELKLLIEFDEFNEIDEDGEFDGYDQLPWPIWDGWKKLDIILSQNISAFRVHIFTAPPFPFDPRDGELGDHHFEIIYPTAMLLHMPMLHAKKALHVTVKEYIMELKIEESEG